MRTVRRRVDAGSGEALHLEQVATELQVAGGHRLSELIAKIEGCAYVEKGLVEYRTPIRLRSISHVGYISDSKTPEECTGPVVSSKMDHVPRSFGSAYAVDG